MLCKEERGKHRAWGLKAWPWESHAHTQTSRHDLNMSCNFFNVNIALNWCTFDSKPELSNSKNLVVYYCVILLQIVVKIQKLKLYWVAMYQLICNCFFIEDFFLMQTIFFNHFLKSLLNLLHYCFGFMFLIFWPQGMWELKIPNQGLNP